MVLRSFNNRRRVAGGLIKAAAAGSVVLAGLVSMTGCEVKSFIDPSEVGRYRTTPLLLPILRKLDTGIEEPTDEWTNATEPLPQDLVFTAKDYRVTAGDLLNVSVSDIGGPGTETARQVRVSDAGTVNLPLLDEIPAVGMTETQLQKTIKKAYADANLVTDATVQVTVVEARSRTFSILGAVGSPGEYQIVKKDFRLIDALVLARDAGGNGAGEFMYIYRRDEPKAQEMEAPAAPAAPVDPAAAPAPAPNPTTPGPDILAPRSRAGSNADRYAQRQAWRIDLLQPRAMQVTVTDAPATPAATPPAAPATDSPAPAAVPAPSDPTTLPSDAGGRYVIIDGKPVLVGGAAQPANDLTPTTAPASVSDLAPSTVPAVLPPPTPPSGFAFQDIAATSGERIIRVPLGPLKNGDFRYNLVVRPGDTIFVPGPKTGFYYMGGHVQRTGVYTLSGSRVTLKQAIIAAGMLDGVAIPQRTDVIRRIGTDREVFARVNLDAIFEGKQPDIFLKPDDTVMVGTNFFAPFIAAIRNGFRFSYGFGFFYDRNFGSNNNNNYNNNF